MLKLFILLVTLLLPPAVLAEDQPPVALRQDYHPATTETEKTLEYILEQAAKHYVIGGNYDYTNTALTPAVLEAITEAQNYANTHNCSGTEALGTNCGLKYNPVTCHEDIPLVTYFRSEKSEEYLADIYVSENPDGNGASKYRLIYYDHEWKIDGIRCGNGETFNYD